ncbi:molybdopterin-dependent oxidoreductase [Streptomyces beihaiensis]|uniref:Molybdopterin-dependent oxidoreductase n=1 Tax=Streptomyces beihaiensis TaxID=2984495 RepID=A0ABT3TMI4_9ACTN|nr:molybdopterin-dependent oxidoreductase [Streptomyces beihaiensis]MCX3058248.1 molybdopterin-dependent oxidoreductase [Streptomyces beihaiensis]
MNLRFRPPAADVPPHDARTATVIGRLLGVALLVCFLTGLVSHYLQEPPGWVLGDLPTRPVWGYRVTQGAHVISGIAAIPLLLVKLWTVFPRLFVWPPVRSVGHALERLSIAVLVSATLLEVFMGLLNTAQWYPWPFSFRSVHWALAWVVAGSLVLHLAVKAPLIAAHWRRRRAGPETGSPDDATDATVRAPGSGTVDADRRSLLIGVGVAVTAVTAVTAGQSVTALKGLDLLAPRDPDHGPQGLPVNRTARAALVRRAELAHWRLTVTGPHPFTLSLAELRALPQHAVTLPIACVEGWSKTAHWEGVRVRDLLARAGLPDGARLRVVSLQRRGAYRVTEMDRAYTRDGLTLLALRLGGEELSMDHGFPARIIAPNRPGVLQTKWVSRLEVISA